MSARRSVQARLMMICGLAALLPAPLLVWPETATASSSRSRPAPANTASPAEIRHLTSGPPTYREVRRLRSAQSDVAPAGPERPQAPKGDPAGPPSTTLVRTLLPTAAPAPASHGTVRGVDPAPPGVRTSPQDLAKYTKSNNERRGGAGPSPSLQGCASSARKPSSPRAMCSTSKKDAPPSARRSQPAGPTVRGTPAIRGFVSPRAVSNNGYSVSLNASPRALAPGQTSSLTATSNTDVGSTPYYIEIYDDNTGALVTACGSGTSCTASVSQPSPASKNFTAYVASSSSTEPPLNVQASSDPVAVTWLSVALGADPTLVGTGGSSRLTAVANTDVGPTPFDLEIFDQTSGTFLAACGTGDTCSTTVSQQAASSHTYVAYVSSYGTASPPPGIQATSGTAQVTWRSTPPLAREMSQFAGVSSATDTSPGSQPPDTGIAVGTTQVVEVVNRSIAVFDKNGKTLPGGSPRSLYDMFGVNPGASSGINSVSDPKIQFDAESGRYFMSELLFDTRDSSNTEVQVAVSPPPSGLQGSDARGAWKIFSVATSSAGVVNILGLTFRPGVGFDQPRLGVNSDKVTIAWDYGPDNTVSCSPRCGEDLFVGDKGQMLTSNTFQSVLRTDSTEFGIVPATSVTPTTTEYAVYHHKDFTNNSKLEVKAITGTPSQNNVQFPQTDLNIGRTQSPPQARQPGTSQTIPTGDDRVSSVVWRNNDLWAASNNNCQPATDTAERSCLRVHEVSTAGATPVLVSDNNYGTPGRDFYYPAISLDGAGHMFLAFSESSASLPPSAALYMTPTGASYSNAYLTYRLGQGAYTSTTPPNRWGDYSGIAVDPADNRIWAAQEYTSSLTDRAQWGTAIGSFVAAPTADWSNRSPGTSPGVRSAAAMAYDPVRQEEVLFGGCAVACPSGDTWTFDGSTWTQRSPATAPPARIYPMMAWDPGSQRVLLFGGSGTTSVLNDTWAWDGSTWTQVGAHGAPPARYEGGLAADRDGHLIEFGGYSTSGQFNDTWSYNGTTDTWTQQPAHAPTYRAGMQLAYDENTEQTVLFGGNTFSCPNTTCAGVSGRDTWTWDGTDWTQQTPAASPPARAFYQMAYNGASAGVTLFGGQDASILDDTWTWDGQNWNQQAPVTSAPARDTTAMVYDSDRQRVTLYGGIGAGGGLADTWSYGAQ